MELTREIQVQKPSSQKDLVQKLKAQAAKSPAFSAMCHIFALRERARQQVTLKSLSLTMQKEGFAFNPSEYEVALVFLASVGLGKLDYNAAGRLRGLKDIKVTLQSIGMAAIAKTDQLKTGQFQHKFKKLPLPVNVTPKKPTPANIEIPWAAPKPEAANSMEGKTFLPRKYPLTMIVNVEGQPFSLSVPGGATMDEVGAFMQQLITKKSVL